jgi:carbonic anhydrase
MATFTNQKLHGVLKERYPQADKASIDAIDFLPFTDLEQSVKVDVAYLKGHELIKKDSVISGWVYDVKTGKVSKSSMISEPGSDGDFQINRIV